MKKFIVFALWALVLIAIVGATIRTVDYDPDQSCIIGGFFCFDIKDGQWISQSLWLNSSGYLDRIQVPINISSGTGVNVADVIFTYANGSGAPDFTQNITTNVTFNVSAALGIVNPIANAPIQWVNITFPPQKLQEEVNYSVRITCNGGNGEECGGGIMYWAEDRNNTQGFERGHQVTSSGSTVYTRDMWFELFTFNALEVNLSSPVNASSFSSSNVLFNITSGPDASVNLTNTTIYIWKQDTTLLTTQSRTDTATVGAANTTAFNMTVPVGTFYWNILSCGIIRSSNGAICEFGANNRTLTIATLVTNPNISSSWDTDNKTFISNISLVDPTDTLFATNLIFNGTPHTADRVTQLTPTSYQVERTIDIPIVNFTSVKNFYWQFTFENAGSFRQENSTFLTMDVNPTAINRTIGNTVAINYTIFDEVTLQPITAIFDGVFDWYLGSGTVTKSDYNVTKAHEINFYAYPDNRTHYTDVFIELDQEATASDNFTYASRIFDFNNEPLWNVTIHQPLYLINSSAVTNVNIEVKDQGLRPLEDVYVKIYRFYPEDNQYRVVEHRRTDEFGQFVAKLVERDVKYRLEFRDSSNRLLKETDDITISCKSAICVVQFVIEDTITDLEVDVNVTGYSPLLAFNNNTNTFTFTWSDGTGDVSVNRLLVQRILFNGTTTVCGIEDVGETNTASIGQLTCAVGDSTANYRAQAYRSSGGNEVRVGLLNIKVGGGADTFGLEGMMWSFVLLFTLIAVGAFNPIVGVLLYLVGLAVLGFINVVYLNPAVIIAQIVIGALFIWAFRG